MSKKFIWYFYKPECDIFENIKLSSITRIFYMATYVSENGSLRLNGKNLTKSKLEILMGVSQKEFKRFWTDALSNNIISYDGDKMIINTNIFHIGWIKPKIKYLKTSKSKIVKIYIDDMRYVYKQSSIRGHKIIGNVFKLIPYYDFKLDAVIKNSEYVGGVLHPEPDRLYTCDAQI